MSACDEWGAEEPTQASRFEAINRPPADAYEAGDHPMFNQFSLREADETVEIAAVMGGE